MVSQRLGRRSFNLGLVGALTAAMLPRASRAGAAKVLILGGSTFNGALGKYLEESLRESGLDVQRHAKSASGLARPDFHDWPKDAAARFAKFPADATLVMFGGNDGQALFMGEQADPKWIKWEDTSAWAAEYRRRVDAFADAVAPTGQHVFWLGAPEMASSKLDARMQVINAIVEQAMQARSAGHYVSTRDLIPGVSGYSEFATIDGKQVRVRAEDGVHYSLHGAKFVAQAVLPELGKALGVGVA
jgi:hypothetical protein